MSPNTQTKPMTTKEANAQRSLRVLGERSFQVDYVFDAPREQVFKAYTDPKLIPLWWAQPGSTLHVERMDVRPGGTFRYVQEGAKRQVFTGEYRAIEPVGKLVYTIAMGDLPSLLTTVELTERGGRTFLLMTTECPSKEDRDSMTQYGAEAGAKGAWARLAQVLANPAPVTPAPVGQLGYTTLFVADQDRAVEFYTKVLGFELRGDAPQPGGHRFIAMNVPGQQQFVVLWPGTPGKSAAVKGNLPGHLIFLVADIDQAFAELKARGAKVEEHAPVKAPFASFVTVVDPDGNRIMVQQQAVRAPGA